MFEIIIDKIFSKYFKQNEYKFIYLYDELLISLYIGDEFIFYGIKLKANDLDKFIYSGKSSKLLKILDLIFINYKKIFIDFLTLKKKSLNSIGEESDFINIFDKKELSYYDIKNKLIFTFLDDYSYRRRKEMSFKLEQSYIEIYHSDFECSICDGPKESFTNFPDYSRKIDYNYYGDTENIKNLHLNTYINDYESINIGGNKKVSEILSAKDLINDYDTITLNKTCISVIMGDDIESIFKYNNIPKEKIIYTDQNIDSGYKSIINFLKHIEISDIKTKKDNNIVLFFGLAKTRNTYELSKFLENNFGIIVDKILIPNINKNDIESIMSYNLSIFFNSLDSKTQSVFKMYPTNNLTSDLPYGITSTEKLVNNLLEKLGYDLSESKKIFVNIREKQSIFISSSNKYTLGFILFPFHLKQFNMNNFRGVPILDLLYDLGFNYKFFIYDYNIDFYKKDLAEFNNIGFETFISGDKSNLDKFILDKNISLIYSEISNDKRILDLGKGQFSVGDFEYGIDGFFRTLDRLLLKCNKQNYYNYLLDLNGK